MLKNLIPGLDMAQVSQDIAGVGKVFCEIRDRLDWIYNSVKPSRNQAVFTATAGDALGGPGALAFQARRLDVVLYDRNLVIQRGVLVDGQRDSETELLAPGYYSFHVLTRWLQVRNATAGQPARYTIIVWD